MRKFILLLAIVLTTNFASAINFNLSVSTSVVDTIPKTNPDLAFNLCYNSLVYWYQACGISDSLLVQERKKIAVYEKITGIAASNTEDLEQISKIKNAQMLEKDEKIASLTKDLKSVKRKKTLWKVGTFVFVPTALVGGVIIGVKIAK